MWGGCARLPAGHLCVTPVRRTLLLCRLVDPNKRSSVSVLGVCVLLTHDIEQLLGSAPRSFDQVLRMRVAAHAALHGLLCSCAAAGRLRCPLGFHRVLTEPPEVRSDFWVIAWGSVKARECPCGLHVWWVVCWSFC